MNDILFNRTKSSIGISIGTDLALESLFTGKNPYYDSDRVIPNRVNIKQYSHFMVNVETLVRNMIASVGGPDRVRIRKDDVIYCAISELDFIKGYLDAESEEKCTLLPYKFDPVFDKNDIYKNANFRTSISDATKYVDSLIELASNELVRQGDVHVALFKKKIGIELPRKTLMLTHSAIDLVSYSRYEHLDLLESNTGLLKDRGLFYTKLHNGKSLRDMPLNSLTLQVFGDNHTFRPQGFVMREMVIGIAAKRKWTAATTDDKVRGDVKSLASGETRDSLLSMI